MILDDCRERDRWRKGNKYLEDHREMGSERKKRFEMSMICCDSRVTEAHNLPKIARHERPTACCAQA